MGKMRTTYVLGASIVAIGLVFGLTMTIPGSISGAVSEANTSMLMGHATIMFTDPDGTVKYIQTDNQIHNQCLTSIMSNLIGFGTAPGTYDSINFYTGSVGNSDVAPAGLLTTKTDSTNVAFSTTTSETSPAKLTVKMAFPLITVVAADSGQFVETVALTTGAGDTASICSSLVMDGPTDCSAGCGIVTGTTIQVDYTLALT